MKQKTFTLFQESFESLADYDVRINKKLTDELALIKELYSCSNSISYNPEGLLTTQILIIYKK